MVIDDDDILRDFITVDPKELAHCKMCYEPLFIIFSQELRDYCHQCTMDMKIDMIA